MSTSYSKTYQPNNVQNKVFVRKLFPPAELVLSTDAFTLPVDFNGFSRQSYKVTNDDNGGAGAGTVDVTIQSLINDDWVDKPLGVAVIAADTSFEHHADDLDGKVRIRFQPKVALPTTGIFVEIRGKKDTSG
jgi:hypothetical protein